MQVGQETLNGRLVLTPHGSLLCAGPAEQFEALLQNVLAEGHRHVIVVLEHVPHVDSGGVRALVRGHLTAQRLGGIHCARQHRSPRPSHPDDDATGHGVPDFPDGGGRDCRRSRWERNQSISSSAMRRQPMHAPRLVAFKQRADLVELEAPIGG